MGIEQKARELVAQQYVEIGADIPASVWTADAKWQPYLRAVIAALSAKGQEEDFAREVFRIAGGDTECCPNPSLEQALECLRDLRKCYDESLNEPFGNSEQLAEPVSTAYTLPEARRWPFVESPGEFTERLARAMQEFPLLGAVRHVLIENPPALSQQPAVPPFEPTASMVMAASGNIHRDFGLSGVWQAMYRAWQDSAAMEAALSQQPAALSTDSRAVAEELLHCFEAWEPGARVLGNVQAKDGADLMRRILATTAAPSGEAVARINFIGAVASVEWLAPNLVATVRHGTKLYTAPQQPAAIPRLANCGRYTATDNTGQHYYLNHANTWQTFQGQQPAAPGDEAVAIYQLRKADGSWIDQERNSYEYNMANGHADSLRIVYTAPQQPAGVDELRALVDRTAIDHAPPLPPNWGSGRAYVEAWMAYRRLVETALAAQQQGGAKS